MLKIGIVGLPNVGKSTLFQALTKKQVDTSNYPFATIDPNVGVVAVEDKRLWALSEFSHSKKTVPASIEFVDIAGLVKGAHQGEGLGNQFLSHIREVDAILEVVRAFEDPGITHVSGRINPEEDVEIINTELILADLETVNKGVARVEKLARGGNKEMMQKLSAFEKTRTLLSEGKTASLLPHDTMEDVKELNLLTAKPFLLTLNKKNDITIPSSLNSNHQFKKIVALNIKLEDEISYTAEADEEIKKLSEIDSLIRAAYETVGLITFFTTGEDETRAWPIRKDSTAPQAGRVIHSDFETKFIRAEVINCETLLNAGSYAKAREQGLIRTEGKKYLVQDGDVVEFKI